MPKTILLADDSTTIRKVVELTFCDTDIRVEAVDNGNDALERLVDLQPDLILADVGMAEPSGYEICRHVKSSQRPVPVVLLAGTFEPFDETRAAACGADGHVIKPFQSAALVRQVTELLDRSERAVEAPPQPPIAESPEVVERALGEMSPVSDAYEEPEARDDSAELEPLAEIPEEARRAEGEKRPARPDTVLTPDQLDAVARAVAERLTGDALREIAWEVVPQLAETIIRERIRELEREIED